MKIHYKFTQQCEREFKKLQKKFTTLANDVERFCHVTFLHEEQAEFPKKHKNYTILKEQKNICIYKARMACSSLKGNKFRVIYARHEDSIEIIFIELYIKSKSNREDTQRISDYLSQFN